MGNIIWYDCYERDAPLLPVISLFRNSLGNWFSDIRLVWVPTQATASTRRQHFQLTGSGDRACVLGQMDSVLWRDCYCEFPIVPTTRA
jgi:hypothetical protein